MKTLYLVDYIGISSGVRYYHAALEEQIGQIENVSLRVLSNYAAHVNEKPFIPIIFNGGALRKIWSLLTAYFRISRHVRQHRDAIYMFECYGSLVDIVLMPAILRAKNTILDIHDPIMKGKEEDSFILKQLSKNYKRSKVIVYHAESALKTVEKLGFQGEAIYVPHFSYNLSEDYDEKHVSEEVKNTVQSGKINILFFGNINYSKGPDILLQCIKEMPADSEKRLNFIMAGKISDDSIKGYDVCVPNLHTVFRTINDDELKYLYGHADYMIMPYRETYQSGVLEMAFRFKVPVIVSDIPYFKSVIEKYPSFGIVTGTSPVQMVDTITSLPEKSSGKYFQQKDIERYNNRSEFILFREKLDNYFSRC
jgi:glycosyltransferase involved in cell wall biosynthesis